MAQIQLRNWLEFEFSLSGLSTKKSRTKILRWISEKNQRPKDQRIQHTPYLPKYFLVYWMSEELSYNGTYEYMVQLKSNVDFWFLAFLMQWISSIFSKCWKLCYSFSEKCWKFIASKMLEIESWHLTWGGS